MGLTFQKAERKKAKLRLALAGPSGSGKTWGALKIAKGIGGRVAVIDTERGSASLYSHLFDYDHADLTAPYSPERFVDGIRAVESAGYDVLVIDSITHEWNGVGGCLEINDKLAAAKFKGNTWAAWNETTPRHRAFLDAILQSPLHIIATMRSKTDSVQEGGKVKKVGLKNEQREGCEYEFTTVLNIVHEGHYAVADKDRSGLFAEPHVITEETGRRLLDWLNTGAGADAPPPPTPAAVRAAGPATIQALADMVARKPPPADATKLAAGVEWVEAQLFRLRDDFGMGDLDASLTGFARVSNVDEIEPGKLAAAWDHVRTYVAGLAAPPPPPGQMFPDAGDGPTDLSALKH